MCKVNVFRVNHAALVPYFIVFINSDMLFFKKKKKTHHHHEFLMVIGKTPCSLAVDHFFVNKFSSEKKPLRLRFFILYYFKEIFANNKTCYGLCAVRECFVRTTYILCAIQCTLYNIWILIRLNGLSC